MSSPIMLKVTTKNQKENIQVRFCVATDESSNLCSTGSLNANIRETRIACHEENSWIDEYIFGYAQLTWPCLMVFPTWYIQIWDGKWLLSQPLLKILYRKCTLICLYGLHSLDQMAALTCCLFEFISRSVGTIQIWVFHVSWVLSCIPIRHGIMYFYFKADVK